MDTVKYTGPVASFHCPTNAEIRSLKVHFSPKQEGSGDPSPENVRPIVGWDGVEVKHSGRNLFDVNNAVHISNAWCNSTSHKIVTSNGDETLYIPCLANSVYIVSKSVGDVLAGGYTTDVPVAGADLYSYYRDNSARTITITTGANAKYIAIWYYDKSKTNDKTMTPEDISNTIQIEFGAIKNYFEPYQGSTTDYEFGVLGKNKFPLRATNQFLNTSTGWSNTNARDMTTGNVFVGISSNNYWNGRSNSMYGISIGDGSISYHAVTSSYGTGIFVPVSPNTEYTLSHAETAAMTRIGYYDSEGNHLNINRSFTGTSHTFTTTTDTTYILVVFATDSTGTEGDYTVSNIQLELGSSATTYEPYDPKHTVYGGWVDLVSGEVVQTYNSINLGSVNWVKYSNAGNDIKGIFISREITGMQTSYPRPQIYCSSYAWNRANVS